jgi:predicted HicB family RNase H-like nuclease
MNAKATSSGSKKRYARSTVSEVTSARALRSRPDQVNMHLVVDKELHRAAKIFAIHHGVTLRELVVEAMEKRIGFKKD